ncbi:MAG: hypothetical protein J1F32_01990 [Erysipelotrichales bacterium]|nr:hypothetical protein [Erysipelotrichales bacterium]
MGIEQFTDSVKKIHEKTSLILVLLAALLTGIIQIALEDLVNVFCKIFLTVDVVFIVFTILLCCYQFSLKELTMNKKIKDKEYKEYLARETKKIYLSKIFNYEFIYLMTIVDTILVAITVLLYLWGAFK